MFDKEKYIFKDIAITLRTVINFLPEVNLIKRSIKFFAEEFSVQESAIEIKKRETGRQLSKKVEIKKDGKVITYHVKTHAKGFSSLDDEYMTETKAVDLKELFVYKALEKIGIGPEVLFFHEDFSPEENFYIATKDLGEKF